MKKRAKKIVIVKPKEKSELYQISHLVLTFILSVVFIILFLNLFYLAMIYYFPIEIPKQIPADMKFDVNLMLSQSKSDFEFVQDVYHFVDNRYGSTRLAYLWFPEKVLERNFTAIWDSPGYQPCYGQNIILKDMLLESGHFKIEDIQSVNILSYFPHQYLKVKVDGAWLNVDPWGADHNVAFNEFYYPYTLFTFIK
jgi:hypothetical protein